MRTAIAVLLTGVLIGQQGEPLRVAVRLVEINVVATDKVGKPVTDLSKDDFEVLDNGKPQEIRFFALEPPAQAATAERSEAALPKGVYSNRRSLGAKSAQGASVVLFDLLNTEFADQADAKKQLVSILRKSRQEERIGIYVLGRGVSVLHDFTDSPRELEAVLARFEGQPSSELAGSTGETQERAPDLGNMKDKFADVVKELNAAKNVQRDYYTIDRVTITLKAFETIANHLARFSGRKTVVWISGSFPFTIGAMQKDLDDPRNDSPNRERRSFQREFDSAMRAVSDANIAIYPVDARGLTVSSEYDATIPAGSEAGFSRGNEQNASQYTPSNRDSMENLASKSGGRAFFNTNDLQGAIGSALADGRTTYTLAYTPTMAADEKFHTLKVQVKRRNVTLRYRQGYLASERAEDLDPQAVLKSALQSPLDATSIGLTAKAEMPQAKGGDWTLLTTVDCHDLAISEKDKKWVGQVQVVYSVQTETGSEIAGVMDKINLDLKPEVWAKLSAEGLTLKKEFRPPDKAYKVRVAILDVSAGRVGSITIPLSSPEKR